jgi:hypothetical protein
VPLTLRRIEPNNYDVFDNGEVIGRSLVLRDPDALARLPVVLAPVAADLVGARGAAITALRATLIGSLMPPRSREMTSPRALPITSMRPRRLFRAAWEGDLCGASLAPALHRRPRRG